MAPKRLLSTRVDMERRSGPVFDARRTPVTTSAAGGRRRQSISEEARALSLKPLHSRKQVRQPALRKVGRQAAGSRGRPRRTVPAGLHQARTTDRAPVSSFPGQKISASQGIAPAPNPQAPRQTNPTAGGCAPTRPSIDRVCPQMRRRSRRGGTARLLLRGRGRKGGRRCFPARWRRSSRHGSTRSRR